MEFKDILKKLNTHIDGQLEEIAAIGQEANELDRQIDKLYLKMQTIYMSLEDVHPLIRERHSEQLEFLENLATYKSRFKDKQ